MLACFPDLEKVQTPASIVPKAGVSIQKRMAKLDSMSSELNEIIKNLQSFKEEAKLPEQSRDFI